MYCIIFIFAYFKELWNDFRKKVKLIEIEGEEKKYLLPFRKEKDSCHVVSLGNYFWQC